ncbi:(2Fe-2S)-binding protein [Isachenkonia alkalipeptolytica]|uniref:(2Fe-2S)-binding protein n=1 Tax=Isachenkonia alkalipeptolytica TaxID=2565777 RepID=A0AA44BDW8_9CLOT|nr:(2Fe-2S)-binding protein [Isachenkonia alkalipeptolytica]NBG88739.1 (2Fe-2S)-binding protein [Isachenkonia alkalipeptolytica]
MNQRIESHPIIDVPLNRKVKFFYNGKIHFGVEGDTVASALHAAGITELSKSIKHQRPRGFYCAIGNCSSCFMRVNGKPNVKTCVEPLQENMVVESQGGRGSIK